MMKRGKWNPAAPKIDRTVPRMRRGRSVVYVIAEEGADRSKVGTSTELKARLLNLQTQHKCRLHVCFWAIVDYRDAYRLETLVHRALAEQSVHGLAEWYWLSPRDAAWQIIESASAAGITLISTAGAPGEIEGERSDVEEILSEDAPITRHFQRQPRYIWAPQAGSLPPLTAKKKCAI